MTQTPPKERGRWTSKRKREAVLRLLGGDSLDVVTREMKVTAATPSKRREARPTVTPGPRRHPRAVA